MLKLHELLNHPLLFLRDARLKQMGDRAGRPNPRRSWRRRRANTNGWRSLLSHVDFAGALADASRIGPEIRFVYFPWAEGHTDAIIRDLARSGLAVAPISLFPGLRNAQARVDCSQALNAEPDLYRRLCLRVLLKLPRTVRGVLVSMDYVPAMRQLVFACKEAQFPTIVIPQEGTLNSRAHYYVDPDTGADCPIADHACVWGPLQAEIFEQRGYPKERITVTGAPRFDSYGQFQPELTREQFCRLHRFDPTRPLIVFAGESFDSYHNSARACAAQARAIADLADYCERTGTQLLVREPPEGGTALDAVMRNYRSRPHVRLDWAPTFLTGPEEAIYHSTVVCSTSGALLFDATLLGRPAVSAKYGDIDSLWEQLGGATATSRASLLELLDRCVAGDPPRLDTSVGSPLARALSVGAFDGDSTLRLTQALTQFAEAPPPCFGVGRFEHLFTERVVERPPQGVIGYHIVPTAVVCHVPAMLGCRTLKRANNILEASCMDAMAYWGGANPEQKQLIGQRKSTLDGYARRLGIPRLVLEDGLIRSMGIGLSGTPTLSLIIDLKAPYYDATQPTTLEDFLNDDWSLSPKQLARVRHCIELIANRRVSKYNHAPDRPLDYPKGSVLVIDQRHGDMSVTRGLGNDALFSEMLLAAHNENPGRAILVKRHPDAMSGGKQAYFSDATMAHFSHLSRLQLLDFETNPHALFDVCSKVYVVSSGMGFEALMRGLEVHCFGVPFYASWGITQDRQICTRRRRPRSLEELFHAAFLVHSRYFHPGVNRVCDLEELVEYIGDCHATSPESSAARLRESLR